MTLLVWLPSPHHCRRPVFHRAFHRLPQLAIRLHVRAVRPRPKHRMAVRPPQNRGWLSDHEPRRSDRQALRSSFITCFADLGRPRVAPTTLVAPHVASSSSPAPHATLASKTPTAPPMAPVSHHYPLHYSCHPRAEREPPALPLHLHSPSVKAVPVAPPINPHPMTTRVKRGFQPTDSPYQPPRHQPCRRCPPPFVSPSSIQTGVVP
jgi:hypothetical protein